MSKEFWNKQHQNNKGLYEYDMIEMIKNHRDLVDRGPVLDIGVGSGRNSLWFARNGYPLDVCDISEEAINKLRGLSEKESLKIAANIQDLRDLDLTDKKYQLIICAFVFNFFKKSEVDVFLDKILMALDDGGYFYLGLFGDHDPVYGQLLDQSDQVEDMTFYLHERESYCFLPGKTYLLDKLSKLQKVALETSEYQETYGRERMRGIYEYFGRNSTT